MLLAKTKLSSIEDLNIKILIVSCIMLDQFFSKQSLNVGDVKGKIKNLKTSAVNQRF